MATTLKITEGAPAAYPTIATGLASPTTAFLAAVWQRMESFIGWRWGSRSCTFIVDGPGAWESPLQPVTAVASVEFWNASDAWEAVTQRSDPLGGYCFDDGVYRVTATIGDTATPPGAVQEAFRRLAAYLAENDGSQAGLQKTEIEGLGTVEFTPQQLAPRSIQYSGAGDLLRPWRNLGAS